MVNIFVSKILRAGSGQPGIFGEVSDYFGTVEAQGRLTLHLHCLVWIKNSLPPDELKKKLTDKDFLKNFKLWMEDTVSGQYLGGETEKSVELAVQDEENRNRLFMHKVTETLPRPVNMEDLTNINSDFCSEVNSILFKCNRHTCYEGCGGKTGLCRARFPRELQEESRFDSESGHFLLRKHADNLNEINPTLTYIMRSNTDVTPLMSGTATKAVIAYVCDYITKAAFSTYAIFSALKTCLGRKNNCFLDLGVRGNAQKILTQTSNILSANQEVGGPMIALYLQKGNDYYTDSKFNDLYWSDYLAFCQCTLKCEFSLLPVLVKITHLPGREKVKFHRPDWT